MVWEWLGCLLKCRVKVLVLVGMPKPPMRATISDAAPVWIKAMLFANEVVGSVCSDETMSRNGMTTGTELFAFEFREQVWAKTDSDDVENPLVLGRECMHYGRHGRPDEKKPQQGLVIWPRA